MKKIKKQQQQNADAILPFEKWKEEFFASDIKNSTDYAKGYKKHKGWPASPQYCYRKDMISWPKFLGHEDERRGVRFSYSYLEWKEKVKALGVKTGTEYIEIAILGRELPTNPNVVFKDDWKNWGDVFDRSLQKGRRYNKNWMPFDDLKILVKENGIKTVAEYQSLRNKNKNKGIPSQPGYVYPEWKDWQDFLRDGQTLLLSYEDLQSEVQAKAIKNWKDYEVAQKKNNRWPCYPPRSYKAVWVSWKKFLGQSYKSKASYWIPFEQFQSELKELNILSIYEFNILRRKEKELQKKWPLNPVGYYKVSSIWKMLGFNSKKEMMIARKLKRKPLPKLKKKSLPRKFIHPVKVRYTSIKSNPFLDAVRHVVAF